MKTIKLISLLFLIIIFGSCNQKKDISYNDVDQMVKTARECAKKISINDLKLISEHHGPYKIIDCREEDEFLEGHIPGALNIPRGILEFSGKISDRRESIYIYSLTDSRASLACPVLKSLKYNKVYLVEGGWQAWNSAYPELIEKDAGGDTIDMAPKSEESDGCGG